MTKEEFIQRLKPIGNLNADVYYLHFSMDISGKDIASQDSIEALKEFILSKVKTTLDKASRD